MTMRNSASQNSGRKSKNNTFSKINADEISEDLSLGLILDDRDDSLFGGNWSDEEENNDGSGGTPRHLPTLDELEDNNDPDICQPSRPYIQNSTPKESDQFGHHTNLSTSRRIPSRSGRWSSFSWTSLYERTTDSSLSWADDELEKETTDKVKSLFDSIDHCLYEDGNKEENSDTLDLDQRPKTSDSFQSLLGGAPSLSVELQNECEIWKQRFPHLRIVGKAIPCQHYQIKNVPKRSMKNSYHQQRYYSNAAGYKLNDSQGRNSNISSAVSDISTVTLTEETFQNNDDILEENSIEDEDEEIIASHGTYIDEDKSYQALEGVVLNEKFSEDPKKYFEKKLMTAIFRKVWSKVSMQLDGLVNMHTEWILQKQMELTSFGQFSSIDENAILFHSPPTFENGSKMLRNSNRNKSPALSDLNPAPPISLPDLRPSIASAPPVRDVNYVRRPASSQNVKFSQDTSSRSSRKPNKPKRSNTATTSSAVTTASSARPNSRVNERIRNGKSLENKRSPSDERKSANLRRTRSKSGSPPSRVGSSAGFRIGIQAGQPVSLPPIFSSSASDGFPTISGSNSLTSGYSSMSSRLGTGNSNNSSRTTSSIRLDGKMTPNLPKSPSGMTISGTKVKKMNLDELPGRSSRLSVKTPAHWDIRTFTPSQAKPRFRN